VPLLTLSPRKDPSRGVKTLKIRERASGTMWRGHIGMTNDINGIGKTNYGCVDT